MMEEIDFDVDKIDSFAKSVFGSDKSSTKVNLEGLNPVLAERLKMASDAYKEKYGKELPVTSGVRTREEQQSLYDRWKNGEKGIYMPLNPADQPDRKVFHADNVDISTYVPEEFLNQFGISRTLGDKDPVHAGLMPDFKNNTTTNPQTVTLPETTNNIDFDVDKIDSFAKDVEASPPPRKKSEVPFGGLGRGLASVADNIYGVVPAVAGVATYAIERAAGKGTEGSKEASSKVSEYLDKPFGKALGITDTPEYQNEASRRFMNFVGENINKGSEWIAEQTGMPKEDAEYYVNLAMLSAPGLKDTKIGKLVKNEAGLVADSVKHVGGKTLESIANVTPEIIKKPISKSYNWAAENIGTKLPENIVPPDDGAGGGAAVSIPSPTQFSKAEAPKSNVLFNASEQHTPQTIKAALENASPKLKEAHKNIPPEQMNVKAIAKRIDADSLGIELTEGQALGDAIKISNERNNPKNAEIFQNQNKKLTQKLQTIKEEVAPNVGENVTPIESGQVIIDSYKQIDNVRNQAIRTAYKNLEEASQGTPLIDGVSIAKNAKEALSKKLKTDFLAPAIKNQLAKFAKGEPMTFEQFEALRTNLAYEMRRAERVGDGNAAAAAGIVRDAVEQLPLLDEGIKNVKEIADTARKLARERHEAINQDPAYKAAVNDSVPADNFLNKFVIKGVNKNINKMMEAFGKNSLAHEHIKSGTLNWIIEKAGIKNGEGNFKQSGYNTSLKNLSSVKNLETIFDPETQANLKKIGRVSFDLQFQPEGHYVNNSKTFVAKKASQILEQGANLLGGGKYGIPIGSMTKEGLNYLGDIKQKNQTLNPSAGSTLKDISNKKK